VDRTIVSADGLRLAVRTIGQGRPAVLLHGSFGGLDSWAPVVDRLADGVRCWLVARRGCAPSEVPPPGNTFGAEVADVAAVVAAAEQESGEPVHLVGASSGATLALHAARDGRGALARVASLCLVEPPLFAAGPALAPVLADYRRLVEDGDLAAAAALFAEGVAQVPIGLPADLATSGPGAFDPREAIGSLCDLEAMAADTLELGRWRKIEVPVLLMQGGDTWAPVPEALEALAAVLPTVERVVWPGQSHFVTATAPDLVADALRQAILGA